MKKLNAIVFLFFAMMLVHNKVQAQTDSIYAVTTSANPFEDQIAVNVLYANKNVTGVRILDAIGKDISSEVSISIAHRGSMLTFTLDFTNVRPGVYFCSIYTDKGILETRKLFRAAR